MAYSGILLENAPNFITVGDKNYPVRTDFRTWIRYAETISDGSLSPSEKAARVISLCCIAPDLPDNLEKTLTALADFYTAGERGGKGGERVFDFCEDSQLIYAAFMQQYSIDLGECEMHWHKFRALLTSLSRDTKFCEVVAVRAMDLSAVGDKKLREKWGRLKRIYALKDLRTPEQKENDIANMLWG